MSLGRLQTDPSTTVLFPLAELFTPGNKMSFSVVWEKNISLYDSGISNSAAAYSPGAQLWPLAGLQVKELSITIFSSRCSPSCSLYVLYGFVWWSRSNNKKTRGKNGERKVATSQRRQEEREGEAVVARVRGREWKEVRSSLETRWWLNIF